MGRRGPTKSSRITGRTQKTYVLRREVESGVPERQGSGPFERDLWV